MSDQPEIAQKSPCVLEMEPGTYYWCTCGRSQNQPFCDGSHKGTSFSPKEVEITEAKKYAWCACKRSAKGEFCDGAHKRL
ncbi:MAG: CDGSH iron-sulfur domain-containing protein [Deltaproteobacteria bacterium]|nr:CDGSH iron-sulfur domain-containing protein [Deltaproteobacteria bacterium]